MNVKAKKILPGDIARPKYTLWVYANFDDFTGRMQNAMPFSGDHKIVTTTDRFLIICSGMKCECTNCVNGDYEDSVCCFISNPDFNLWFSHEMYLETCW